jgi:hypothetical protein
MPPQLQARFTLAESAVLAVVAAEVRTKGSCSLTIGHIAALAGVCRKTVKTALREAVEHGLMRIQERRLTAWRNASNVITITSPEWNAWLRLRRRGVGVNPCPPRIQGKKEGAALLRGQTRCASGDPARLDQVPMWRAEQNQATRPSRIRGLKADLGITRVT